MKRSFSAARKFTNLPMNMKLKKYPAKEINVLSLILRFPPVDRDRLLEKVVGDLDLRECSLKLI